MKFLIIPRTPATLQEKPKEFRSIIILKLMERHNLEKTRRKFQI
jgi:hypothetical protein